MCQDARLFTWKPHIKYKSLKRESRENETNYNFCFTSENELQNYYSFKTSIIIASGSV